MDISASGDKKFNINIVVDNQRNRISPSASIENRKQINNKKL